LVDELALARIERDREGASAPSTRISCLLAARSGPPVGPDILLRRQILRGDIGELKGSGPRTLRG
jgi:hypothetical protein